MDNKIQSKINDQVNEFFENLTTCNASNLQRLDGEFIDMGKHHQRSVMSIINLPPEVALQWKEEGTTNHYENLAFLISEFERLDYRVPPLFGSIINKLLEEDFDSIDTRDLSKDIKLKSKKLLKMWEITKLPSYKQETDKSTIVPFKQRFDDIDPDALESMLDFYRDHFEFIVNRMLRELYPKYLAEYSLGSNHKLDSLISKIKRSHEPSNFQLLEFFKNAWKDYNVSSLLEHFRPVIRNAIAHDVDNDNVDINYTRSKITFTSGKYKLGISIGEFIAKYWSSVTNLYQLVTLFVIHSESMLYGERRIIDGLKGIRKTKTEEGVEKPLFIRRYLASSDLGPFVMMYNSLVKTLDNSKNFSQIADDFEKFLLDQSSTSYYTHIIPFLVRYSLSKYPIDKPKDFQIRIARSYLKYVKADIFEDDKEFLNSFLKNLEKKE